MTWHAIKPEPPRIGIVLSSGGTRGVFAHTGFLQAIHNLGIPIHTIAGSSAGAFAGGIIASGTPLDQWVDNLAKIRTRDFWTPRSALNLLWSFSVRKGKRNLGISSTKAFRKMIENNVSARNFKDCKYPFYTVAFHLETIAQKMFSEGELIPRILASSALPVLYEPVNIDGEHYCDGALVNITPIDIICSRHKLDLIIVHHSIRRFTTPHEFKRRLVQGEWPMFEIFDRLLYRNSILYRSNQTVALSCPTANCPSPIMVIKPDLPELPWPKVEGGMDIMEEARKFTESRLQPYVDKILAGKKLILPVK